MNFQIFIKCLYFPLIAIIIFCIINLFKCFKQINNNVKDISLVSGNIENSLQVARKRIKRLNYSANNSFSFFGSILLIIILLKAAIKDYQKTKKERSKFHKSTLKKYQALTKLKIKKLV